ncbi:Conidiation protein 6-domain-containing protein [Annulohypoxylon truncatum]|uniref:Conidiation protein 6-domain-containing protein n=1 Tax=Annulohypoxylon truncatum TaxID=327061 RepID=UPI002007F556|nr:Conidiation protein 6-domain-containing protein [Annulohypoxylon truncatum]KAI1205543.1 Conidiation protein 6-domain-containing protein [Annulohypoxylon truncatum]
MRQIIFSPKPQFFSPSSSIAIPKVVTKTMTDQDNYSDIQQEVPADADMEKDPENVYRGHKATISNPRTSQAAKEHSRKVLESETGEPTDASNNVRGVAPGAEAQGEQKDPANV